MVYIKLLLTAALVGGTYIGDHIVFNSKYSSSLAFRAVSDSIVHASIGCLSAILFFNYDNNISIHNSAAYVLICTVISSLIDIDHVFISRSYNLMDQFGLPQRGIFHCTTFWLLVTLILFAYSYRTRKITYYTLCFMVVIAYSSHHLRDANRRGLWFYPYGHTPAINTHVYILMLTVLPNVLPHVYLTHKGGYGKKNVVQYL